MPEYVSTPGTGTIPNQDQETEIPRRYQVLLHNDDYTTMDFVVFILEHIFRKPRSEAMRIMLAVHENGMGIAGVYVKAIAETKVNQVHKAAREQGHPLYCTIAPE